MTKLPVLLALMSGLGIFASTTTPTCASSISIAETTRDASALMCAYGNICVDGPAAVSASIDLFTDDAWDTFHLRFRSIGSTAIPALGIHEWVILSAPDNFEFALLGANMPVQVEGDNWRSTPCPAPQSTIGCQLSFFPESQSADGSFATELHLGALRNGTIDSAYNLLIGGLGIQGYWFGNEFSGSAKISLTGADTTSYSFRLWNIEHPSPVPLPAGAPLLLSGLAGIGVLRLRSTRGTARSAGARPARGR